MKYVNIGVWQRIIKFKGSVMDWYNRLSEIAWLCSIRIVHVISISLHRWDLHCWGRNARTIDNLLAVVSHGKKSLLAWSAKTDSVPARRAFFCCTNAVRIKSKKMSWHSSIVASLTVMRFESNNLATWLTN